MLQEMIPWSSFLAKRNNPFPNRSWELPVLHHCQPCQRTGFIWTLEYCVNTLAVSRTGCVKPSTQQCNPGSPLHPVIKYIHCMAPLSRGISQILATLVVNGNTLFKLIQTKLVFSTVILDDLNSQVELITFWFFYRQTPCNFSNCLYKKHFQNMWHIQRTNWHCQQIHTVLICFVSKAHNAQIQVHLPKIFMLLIYII